MMTDKIFLNEYRTGTNDFVNEFYKKAFNESIEYCYSNRYMNNEK